MRMKHCRPLFAFLAGILSFTAPSLAATSCDNSAADVDIPELKAAKLGNGDHVVARTMTPHGELQVHVTVRGKRISNPSFYIGQKRLNKTSLRRVPKDIRDCLQPSKKKAASAETQQIAFLGPLQQLRLYSPRADVAFRGRCTVRTTCNQSICCSLAKCGGAQAVWCEGFS